MDKKAEDKTAPTQPQPADAEAGGDEPYNREEKLKEILAQDEKNPHADPFMGF